MPWTSELGGRLSLSEKGEASMPIEQSRSPMPNRQIQMYVVDILSNEFFSEIIIKYTQYTSIYLSNSSLQFCIHILSYYSNSNYAIKIHYFLLLHRTIGLYFSIRFRRTPTPLQYFRIRFNRWFCPCAMDRLAFSSLLNIKKRVMFYIKYID